MEVAKNEKGDPLANTVKANARLMAEKIRKEAELGDHTSEVRIVTGYYDLDSGEVSGLTCPNCHGLRLKRRSLPRPKPFHETKSKTFSDRASRSRARACSRVAHDLLIPSRCPAS